MKIRMEEARNGIPGFYIVSGEGDTYKCYGWARNEMLAKKAIFQLKKDLKIDPDASVRNTAEVWK